MKKIIFIISLLLAVGFMVQGKRSEAEGDLNLRNETTVSSRAYVVEVVQADGSFVEQKKGVSQQMDLYAIATELGAEPFVEDKLTIFPDIELMMGGKITLKRAPVYEVSDGKKHYTYRSWKATVGELLSEKKIEVGLDDKINFSKDTQIEEGMKIVITRVAITNVIEKKVVEFGTIKKDDNTLDKGKTKVQKAGQNGQQELTYRVTREDGEEVSRKLIKTETTLEAEDEILLIGTRPVITVRCKFNDIVIEASQKYGVDANSLCTLMIKESNGNPRSGEGTEYQGLYQYTSGFWASASAKAGYGGASVWEAKAQIFTTAWAFSHGERKRWP